MQGKLLKEIAAGESCCGFQLLKKEYIRSKGADLYTMRHEKTGAELLFFDRADENKTFSICFKTLPEDHTGVFHILEHSVLNGSDKFPVKEPFVSMLQSSMQTFLNAMTFDDKTLYPVSSRNEQDFFNLMSIYLDAVFHPMIYKRPEIFMQEGWHYEYESEESQPYYNGVVYNEMKGVYADVDSLMADEMNRMLFPDTCYGYSSGGHPDHITDLAYEQFIATHQRFYHPSNARIILDGQMDVDAVLQYIDQEYLSKYEYRELDFDFSIQTPTAGEKTIFYEAQEGEEELAHVAVAKILCMHDEVEKIYAAKILSDYLTGSNEAPLKRAFLEKGLAQDITMDVNEGVFQPAVSLVIRNTAKEQFGEIKEALSECTKDLLKNGLDQEALMASLERFAFVNKEITEPYGVELAMKILSGWLYGDDPMIYVDNQAIFDDLRGKAKTSYFADLLAELLADPEDKNYLYVLPSLTKGQEDAQREAEKLDRVTADWDEEKHQQVFDAFVKMQQWQMSEDTEENLAALPHLNLQDIPKEVKQTETRVLQIAGREVLQVMNDTNGIIYLNLYFDVSDLSQSDLQLLNVLTGCLGELRTEETSAEKIQTRIKALMGHFGAKITFMAKLGDLEHCKPYLQVSASMLEENVDTAMALIEELLLHGKYDETDKIGEIVLQDDYFQKQALIGEGHMFAMTKALAPFSKESALKELISGETFVNWFSAFAEDYMEKKETYSSKFQSLAAQVFAKERLFAGYSGQLKENALEHLIQALPSGAAGETAAAPVYDQADCKIEIPSSVGFSARGHNLYALGGEYKGSCVVLSSLMSYGYLWNAVRVQGGAYGTGMLIRANGDMLCYSYRDPKVDSTKAAYQGMCGFLEMVLAEDMPLDDMIIGTVNSSDPLLDPAGICDLECTRYLKGITHEDVTQIRKEILETTCEDLKKLAEPLEAFLEKGRFCIVGS